MFAACDKVDLLTAHGEPCTEIAADTAGSNDCYFHCFPRWTMARNGNGFACGLQCALSFMLR
jgi:hypothetical protein